MFSKRSDAKKVKGLDTITKAGPFFLPSRIESQNLYMNEVRCEPFDDFIAREKRNGTTFTYTHIMIASLVRLFYLRPKLNYFISHNVFYEHNNISVCMVIKKVLNDDGEEVTLKIPFTGKESIYDVKEKVDKMIAENVSEESHYSTTDTAGSLNKLPNFMFRMFMALARFLDRHNMLPKSLISASPFHTSVFLTNLKSIKLDAIYHHLYEFGTCSLFIAMGKEKIRPVVEGNKDLKLGKVMKIGVTMDERVCDGFYYGKTLKIWNDIFQNPDCLKERMPDDGSKNIKIKKKKKEAKKVKVKKVKTKSKTKKRSKAQLEKQKLLKKQIKEEKEELREKIKAQKAALKKEV